MKKVVSILMVAVCCMFMATTTAQAQLIKWGVKGGVNLTKIDFDGGNKDNMAGFFIGPMAEVTIPIVGLGVDAALLFSQKGIKANYDATKQAGLDIPVNLKYTIGLGSALGIFIAAGPDFYFDFKDEPEADKKKAQIGINVGAGLKLLSHLQLGVNYNIPIGDHFDIVEVAEKTFKKGKDKTWQISLAYIF